MSRFAFRGLRDLTHLWVPLLNIHFLTTFLSLLPMNVLEKNNSPCRCCCFQVFGKQQHPVPAQGPFLRLGLADRTVSLCFPVSSKRVCAGLSSCSSSLRPRRDLRGNAFECDCRAKWLMAWLRSTNATVSSVLCAGPEHMKARSLNDQGSLHDDCVSTGEETRLVRRPGPNVRLRVFRPQTSLSTRP